MGREMGREMERARVRGGREKEKEGGQTGCGGLRGRGKGRERGRPRSGGRRAPGLISLSVGRVDPAGASMLGGQGVGYAACRSAG